MKTMDIKDITPIVQEKGVINDVFISGIIKIDGLGNKLFSDPSDTHQVKITDDEFLDKMILGLTMFFGGDYLYYGECILKGRIEKWHDELLLTEVSSIRIVQAGHIYTYDIDSHSRNSVSMNIAQAEQMIQKKNGPAKFLISGTLVCYDGEIVYLVNTESSKIEITDQTVADKISWIGNLRSTDKEVWQGRGRNRKRESVETWDNCVIKGSIKQTENGLEIDHVAGIQIVHDDCVYGYIFDSIDLESCDQFWGVNTK